MAAKDLPEFLPNNFDDLADPTRIWPHEPQSREEGLGMLCLLTPQRVLSAAAEIKTGERVCLNWSLSELSHPPFDRRRFEHKIFPVKPGVAFDDEYHLNPQSSSQWDGFRHYNAPLGKQGERYFYGGTTAEEIQDRSNNRIGIQHWAKQGIAGRGVLIDYLSYAEKRGISIDALSTDAVTLHDIETIAKECSIEFQHGDILFLRVGFTKQWSAMSLAERDTYHSQNNPTFAGVQQSEAIIRFLYDRHFSAIASDSPGVEVYPAQDPEWQLHHYLLAGWGMPIGEMFDLEDLSETCKRLNRWTFFFTSSPLNAPGGVSTPPNAMAIF